VTTVAVAPADVGRACPYCRFPLKGGAPAERCDDCGALHHADCWADGHGCAMVGCTQAASTAQPTTDATIVAAAPAHPPPPPPAAAQYASPPAGHRAPSGSSHRGFLIVLATALAVVLAAVAGIALARSGDSSGTTTGADGTTIPARTVTVDRTVPAPAPAEPEPTDDTDTDAPGAVDPGAGDEVQLTRRLAGDGWFADVPSADDGWSVTGPTTKNDGKQIIRKIKGPDGEVIELVNTPDFEAKPPDEYIVEEQSLTTDAARSRLVIVEDFPSDACRTRRCADFLLNDPTYGGIAVLVNGEQGDDAYATAAAIAQTIQPG
jgi:hypothetical protein